jgi:hypothetical protein
MVLVNLARHHHVDAEAALRSANGKFRLRFGIVERLATARGVALRDLSFAELDELWDDAKAGLARGDEAGERAGGRTDDRTGAPAPAGEEAGS